jgi:hypothetical protein
MNPDNVLLGYTSIVQSSMQCLAVIVRSRNEFDIKTPNASPSRSRMTSTRRKHDNPGTFKI